MMCVLLFCYSFFFVKQKTAYEMRISDCSSDVCSSDLAMGVFDTHKVHHALYRAILARDAVKGVENDIWRGFRKACGDIVAHIDACDLVTTAFQRLGDTFPAHQGDRPLGGPAAHQDSDMPGPPHCATPMR